MNPYYSLDDFCKQNFDEKLYKIAIDCNLTCPNRDGTLDTRGCIFCSSEGSGEYAANGNSVASQIETGKSYLKNKRTGKYFIAYFQSFTNTYGPISYLKDIYTQALCLSDIIGISIATRPDCLEEPILKLLSELKQQFPQKFIWIELGLQTIHEKTALYIRRGYPLSCFDDAVKKLNQLSIPIIVHVIIGLPGESQKQLLETVTYLNQCNIFGIKFHLLHILKNTDLAFEYEAGFVSVMTFDEYIEAILECIGHLSPNITIHRMTGDGAKDQLIAPLWSLDKRKVLNTIHKELAARNIQQGSFLTNNQ